MDMGNHDVEAGLPVEPGMRGTGKIRVSQVPGGEVATAVHAGSYETPAETYDALATLMKGKIIEPHPTDVACFGCRNSIFRMSKGLNNRPGLSPLSLRAFDTCLRSPGLKDPNRLANADPEQMHLRGFHLLLQGLRFRDYLSGIHYFSRRHWYCRVPDKFFDLLGSYFRIHLKHKRRDSRNIWSPPA